MNDDGVQVTLAWIGTFDLKLGASAETLQIPTDPKQLLVSELRVQNLIRSLQANRQSPQYLQQQKEMAPSFRHLALYMMLSPLLLNDPPLLPFYHFTYPVR